MGGTILEQNLVCRQARIQGFLQGGGAGADPGFRRGGGSYIQKGGFRTGISGADPNCCRVLGKSTSKKKMQTAVGGGGGGSDDPRNPPVSAHGGGGGVNDGRVLRVFGARADGGARVDKHQIKVHSVPPPTPGSAPGRPTPND